MPTTTAPWYALTIAPPDRGDAPSIDDEVGMDADPASSPTTADTDATSISPPPLVSPSVSFQSFSVAIFVIPSVVASVALLVV